MRVRAATVLAIGLGVLLADRAFAQGVVMQRNVSLGMAKTIADATLAACKAKGYSTSVLTRVGAISLTVVGAISLTIVGAIPLTRVGAIP
jgi:hypothetical protein